MTDRYIFDLNDDTDTDVGFEPLPVGRYTVVISACELKPTKSGLGKYVEVRLDVTSGAYSKRVIWDRMNVENPNPTARSLGRAQFKALLTAIGVTENADLTNVQWINQNLLDKQLVASVGIERSKDGYDPQNRVKGYLPMSTFVPGSSGPTPKYTPPPQSMEQAVHEAQKSFDSDDDIDW